MSINSRTIAKILREHFTGETPIIKNEFDQKEFISQLKSQLEKIKGVTISPYYRSSWDDVQPERMCHFSVEDESNFYDYDSLTLKFNQDNKLVISNYSHTAIVYQIEQIETFIDKLKLEHENKKGHKIKKEKINNLKQQAIIGKLKEFAKEDQFDFYTIEYQRKLKVIIRINGGKKVEIDVPYQDFQNTLKNMRSIIQTLNEMQKSGITFRLRGCFGKK